MQYYDAKSFADPILAVLLFVLFLPLFIIIPLLIKLTSEGPVLFTARRLGLRGKSFTIIKFRSMKTDADATLAGILQDSPEHAAQWQKHGKLYDDPRITTLGRFLRKTSMDELPQLFNVIRGDMALIGPRPIIEKEIDYYGDQFDTLVSVKPGLTGLWQVSGRNDLPYDKRVQLDLFYVKNCNLKLDFSILVKTVREVLSAHGK